MIYHDQRDHSAACDVPFKAHQTMVDCTQPSQLGTELAI